MISEERLRELWHLEGSFASGPYGDEVGRFARAVEAEAVSLERERFAQMLETVAGEVRALKEKP